LTDAIDLHHLILLLLTVQTMANVYNLEPPPTAKVLLHTTAGDISLELFASQTPLTSRNFLQHCLDGYYSNTIFHRLIPGFILQGGDPTGTGHGGESSFEHGAPFADEFHSRLKFNRRGLLGMANGGSKDDNGSQFFLTLGKSEELNGKHTMFGRVEAEGNTVFNLVKMGEADLVGGEGDGAERPLYPTKITSTEVLVNPFKDMVKRDRVATRVVQDKRKVDKEKGKKTKKKGGKGLLSFAGGEEEEGEDGIVAVKLANPKLINTVKEEEKEKPSAKRPAPPAVSERASKRRITSPSPPLPQQAPSQTKTYPLKHSPTPSPSPSPPPPAQSRSEILLSQANAQIAALKASLKRDIPTTTHNHSKPKSALEAMIPSTATRGRRRKGGGNSSAPTKDEQRALDEFNAFRRKLEASTAPETTTMKTDAEAEAKVEVSEQNTARPSTTAAPEDNEEEAALCDLHFVAHCQSCARWDEDGVDDVDKIVEKDDTDAGWLSHKLTFEKDRLGKDLKWKEQNEKELVVIDPREREKELGVGGKKRRDDRGGRKENEWARRAREGKKGSTK